MHIAASGGTFAATIKLLLRRWKCFHGVNEILNLFIESFLLWNNYIRNTVLFILRMVGANYLWFTLHTGPYFWLS